jgi:membrane-associated phospholipid phosphatase
MHSSNFTNVLDGVGISPVPVPGARLTLALRTWTGLARGEQIMLAFFAYLTVVVLLFSSESTDGWKIVPLNLLIAAIVIVLRGNCRRAPWLAAAHNLFPALLLLVAYRESGLLLRPNSAHRLDFTFIQWDRVLLHNQFVLALLQAGTPWLQHYLEFAYLLCYPLVPLGVAAIHFTSRGKSESGADSTRPMDDFWTPVLLATLFCYAVYPFFPLTPPRVLFADVPGPQVEPLLRQVNFWLLDRYSVQACIFPSGHVAAATAVALAVRKQAPRLGALFMFLAASVAVATVYGRYHYAADAMAGALVGIAAYKVTDLFK